MDAKIRQIQIKPAVIDKDGEISKDETATLTFSVELDTLSARKEVVALLEVLSQEYVTLTVENQQLAVKVETAEINNEQVQAQLGVTEV